MPGVPGVPGSGIPPGLPGVPGAPGRIAPGVMPGLVTPEPEVVPPTVPEVVPPVVPEVAPLVVPEVEGATVLPLLLLDLWPPQPTSAMDRITAPVPTHCVFRVVPSIELISRLAFFAVLLAWTSPPPGQSRP